jgi:hypothetical protein
VTDPGELILGILAFYGVVLILQVIHNALLKRRRF